MSDKQPWKAWVPDDFTFPKPEFEHLEPVEEQPESESEQPEPSPEMDNAQQLAMIQVQAHEQGQRAGFAAGHSEGLEAGRKAGFEQGLEQGIAEGKQQQLPVFNQAQQLVNDFQRSLDALDSVIVSRIMQLALEVARQIIGQAPSVDNIALIKQIQTLLAQESLFRGKPQLRVHPDDLQRVESVLGATLDLHGWRLRSDPSLHQGGCKVSADEGDIDASIATRWQELCHLAAPGVL